MSGVPPRDRSGDPALRIVLDGDVGSSAAGAAVEAYGLDLGLPGPRASRLRVVVEELVAESRAREAVLEETAVTVTAAAGVAHLEVSVWDRRLPIDPAEARRARSRHLVASGFADRIHIGRNGELGNVATVAVHVDDEVHHHGPVVDEHAERVDDAAAAALELRPMEPGDAEGLSRCIYRCYGYSYVDPTMYRPRQIVRALRSGRMLSAVAVDPNGEVVGHLALTFARAGEPVPEAGKLVVDPRFRGHHVAERLAGVRLGIAREAGLPGFWSECVTNHAFSQREVIRTGGAETGLLVGAMPASMEMAGMDPQGSGRRTLLVYHVQLRDDGAGASLHVPGAHAEFLTTLVGRTGLDRRVTTDATVGTADATAPCELTTGMDTTTGAAHLRVTRVGDDLVPRVAEEIEGLAAFTVAAAHLDLPLSDPATAGAATELERLGFCWGAWLPGFSPAGDVLRLQRVATAPVQTEVVCARAEGEAVRDHVLAEWRRVARGG